MPDSEGGGGVGDALDAQMALKTMKDRHDMMHQFMRNFATNMKYSVLADSKGDMPEEERQRLMYQLRPGVAPPSAGDEDDADATPMEQFPGPRRQSGRHHHLRMLNAAEAPVPDDAVSMPMARAPDADNDAMGPPPAPQGDGAMAMPPPPDAGDADAVSSPPLAPRRHHHRHRMLNQVARSEDGVAEDSDRAESPESDADAVPIGVPPPRSSVGEFKPRVRDAMGRVMPLLFTGSSSPEAQAKSGAGAVCLAPAMLVLLALAGLA